MFRLTILSIIGLVTGETEGSSLLQTSARDSALASRAQNSAEIEDEDELDDALGGKQCASWLVDEAVANAHDELEDYRQRMEGFGYTRTLKNSVKIGAYCPTIIADSTLTFAGSPCEDVRKDNGGSTSLNNGRENVLNECHKSLKDTCKFMKDAAKKMQGKVKQQLEEAKQLIPDHKHRNLFNPNKIMKELSQNSELTNMNCNDRNQWRGKQDPLRPWNLLEANFLNFLQLLGSTRDSTLAAMMVGRASLGDRVSAHILEQRGMPLEEKDALENGWVRVGKSHCHTQFGRQYQKGNFSTPTLMFADNGYLAGMQFAVDTTLYPLFPDSNLKEGNLIVATGLPHHQGDMALTAYFMDPQGVCHPNTNPPVDGSVGDRLWVLSPDTPGGYQKIPLRQEEGLPAGYFRGGCAATGFAFPGSPGMGTHFFKNEDFLPNGQPDPDQNCNAGAPLFLMYSRGELVAFGLSFVGSGNRLPTTGGVMPTEIGNNRLAMTNGDIWEFARQPLVPTFFQQGESPNCWADMNEFDPSLPFGEMTVATLHVFVKDPFNITCP